MSSTKKRKKTLALSKFVREAKIMQHRDDMLKTIITVLTQRSIFCSYRRSQPACLQSDVRSPSERLDPLAPENPVYRSQPPSALAD